MGVLHADVLRPRKFDATIPPPAVWPKLRLPGSAFARVDQSVGIRESFV
jgi:hypothetical protein